MRIPQNYAYLAVFIGVWGHATSEFFAKLSGVAGPETSVWRYMIGAAGLLVWSLLTPASRDILAPLRQRPFYFIGLSFIGVTLAYLAFHWSLDYATVPQVATLMTTIPIFVGVANWIFTGVPMTRVKIVTGVLAALGVALLITDGYLGQLQGGANLKGILLALICPFLAAIYSVKIKPFMAEHGALTVTTASLIVGAIGLWLLVGLFWSTWVNPFSLFERPAIESWSLLTLGVWNTTITQVLWLGGLAAAADITRASYIFFLKPVIAAALAFLILSTPLTPLQLLAIIVVTSCVAVEILWPKLFGNRETA